MVKGRLFQTTVVETELKEINVSGQASTHLTIMTKNSMFSFLGLLDVKMIDSDDEVEPVNAVVKLDPREGQPIIKEYPSRNLAIQHYEEAITTSVSRGWQVVYRGVPLRG